MTSMNKTFPISNGLRLAALALAVAGAGSAIAATVSADSTSIVVAPLKITKGADMSFGTFAGGSTPGTVTVSPNGARVAGGGAVLMGGTVTAARFDVEGATGATYSISLGGSTELTSGTNTMAFTTVSDLVGGAITSGNVASGVLTAGTQSIFVGGELVVGAAQAAGTYTGTVSATVEYN